MKLLNFDKLLDTLSGYIETRLEIFKIDIKEEVTAIVSKMAIWLISALCLFMVVLFLFFGMASWLNEVLNSNYWGYMIVAGFFGLLLGLIMASKEKLTLLVKKRVSELQGKDKSE